jgi:hypothetical protein
METISLWVTCTEKIQACIMPKDGKETLQLKIVKIIFTNFIVKEMC